MAAAPLFSSPSDEDDCEVLEKIQGVLKTSAPPPLPRPMPTAAYCCAWYYPYYQYQPTAVRRHGPYDYCCVYPHLLPYHHRLLYHPAVQVPVKQPPPLAAATAEAVDYSRLTSFLEAEPRCSFLTPWSCPEGEVGGSSSSPPPPPLLRPMPTAAYCCAWYYPYYQYQPTAVRRHGPYDYCCVYPHLLPYHHRLLYHPAVQVPVKQPPPPAAVTAEAVDYSRLTSFLEAEPQCSFLTPWSRPEGEVGGSSSSPPPTPPSSRGDHGGREKQYMRIEPGSFFSYDVHDPPRAAASNDASTSTT